MRQAPRVKRTAPFASASWVLTSAAVSFGWPAVFWGGGQRGRFDIIVQGTVPSNMFVVGLGGGIRETGWVVGWVVGWLFILFLCLFLASAAARLIPLRIGATVTRHSHQTRRASYLRPPKSFVSSQHRPAHQLPLLHPDRKSVV